MKKATLCLALLCNIFSQEQITIPFDWSKQNGILIQDGIFFSNQSWSSGILSFDGTYSSYPARYGGHTAKKIEISEIGRLPSFLPLPDSSLTQSFFDYYRGDYGLDKLDIGVEYQSKNKIIKVSGFKRSSFGNFSHYIHPAKSQAPIHQSYRIDYSTKKAKEQIEISAARYITSSGLPDLIQNGFENDNIINSAFRYQRKFNQWTLNSYLSQFGQNRLLIHSLYSDSTSRFINRNRLEVQIMNDRGFEFGLSQKFQQYNSKAQFRSLGWSSLFFRKYYKSMSFMAGMQFSESELYQPYIFSINYISETRIGNFGLLVSSNSQPVHPDRNASHNNEFEMRLRSSLYYDLYSRKFSLKSYMTNISLKAGDLYNYSLGFAGVKGVLFLNDNWQIYSQIVSPLNSSTENKIGTKIDNGLKGKFQLFQNNMKISFHIWMDSYTNSATNFTYDPFLQFPHESADNNFEISNRNLSHLEIESNISGVLLHYKIYNLLNAVGVNNEDVLFKPNAIYPEIGRMMQFGVTWYFDN